MTDKNGQKATEETNVLSFKKDTTTKQQNLSSTIINNRYLNDDKINDHNSNSDEICEDIRILADKIKRRSIKLHETKNTTLASENLEKPLSIDTTTQSAANNPNSCQTTPSGT